MALLALRREAERVRDSAWKKAKSAYDTHIVHAVLHQFSGEPHQPEDGMGAGEQYQADRDTYRQVDEDGYADYLHYFLV